MRYTISLLRVLFVTSLLTSLGHAQVVKFRLETTDLSGASVESVNVGDEFLLKTYTQQVGGFGEDRDDSGVFAGYLDIAYDASLASIASTSVNHGPVYLSGVSSDFTTSGLMDNIGGFATLEPDENGQFVPIGPDEQFLFRVTMRADSAGDLTFTGSESLSYPLHDVLVWTSLDRVPARDIDFGEEALRVDFGTVTLSVNAVPEPSSAGILLVGVLGLAMRIRRSRRKTHLMLADG